MSLNDLLLLLFVCLFSLFKRLALHLHFNASLEHLYSQGHLLLLTRKFLFQLVCVLVPDEFAIFFCVCVRNNLSLQTSVARKTAFRIDCIMHWDDL